MIRIVFFGTETLAATQLSALVTDARFKIIAVVTQPPRPVGRKQVLTKSAVQQLAEMHGIEVYTPETLRDEGAQAKLRSYDADIFVVAQYGLIIPEAVLTIPPHGALNVHGSLLPKYRGASPVHAAIIAGDNNTGVTFMVMDAKMDHGPMLATYQCEITADDTTETLMNRIARLAAEHLGNVIEAYCNGTLTAVEQDHTQATNTKLLTRDSGILHPSTQDAQLMSRILRAYTPWPGISLTLPTGELLKITSAHVAPDTNAPIGTILYTEHAMLIQTIRGALAITTLTPAGKNNMTADAFMRGRPQLNGVCVQ